MTFCELLRSIQATAMAYNLLCSHVCTKTSWFDILDKLYLQITMDDVIILSNDYRRYSNPSSLYVKRPYDFIMLFMLDKISTKVDSFTLDSRWGVFNSPSEMATVTGLMVSSTDTFFVKFFLLTFGRQIMCYIINCIYIHIKTY